MQTTLLGFAFAIILALLVALIGPFLVDWTQFRPVFEAEASRMIGLPVRVTGAIDARLLPSPSLTLHGLEIGGPKPEQALQARLLNVEFALGPLLRGEFRAVEAQLAGPEVTTTIDERGAFDLPKLSATIAPDSLSIERLNIEDGRVHVINAATGSRTTFEKVWFNGDLRSLAGPFKGEGAFVTAGELYGYRVSAGRVGADGALRLRLSLDPSDRLLTAEADGALTLASGKPRFDGSITLSRPAGLVIATGQSKVKLPWRITSRIDLDTAGAKLERIDFLYGAEDNGVRLTGTADLRFGREPSFKAVLSARHLDFDRLIATPDKPLRLPADAMKTLIANYTDALHPPFPTELSVSADTVTLGGAVIQAFGADIKLGDDAWTLDRVEFRAPGLTQVNLGGRLELAPAAGFSGPVRIETNEPGALAGWLNGHNDPATQIRPFKARGDVVLNQQEIAIERLTAEIDRKAVTGRLRYSVARADRPSRLDAQLSAPELDIDALLAFADAARAGTALQPPSEVALGLAVERARIAGIDAKSVQIGLKRDANLLLVERFSVADLGGASLMATGRIDTGGTAPRGSLALDVDARDLDGVIALAEKFAPAAAEPLRRAASRVPAAKLRIALGLDGPTQAAPAAKTSARFTLEGQVGGLRASLHGEARQDSAKTASEGLVALLNSDVRLEAQMDGADGSALVALLGLDKAVAVDRRAGFINVVATGKPSDVLRVDGRILAGGLDGKASGTLRVAGDQGLSADLQLDVAGADVRPLAGDRGAALPLRLSSRVALTDQSAKFTGLKGTLAGTELRGALSLGFASGIKVEGRIEADTLDAAALVAAAIGAPPQVKPERGTPIAWSSEPYGAGHIPDIEGRIGLKVMRASLAPSLPARQLQTALVFRGSEITLDEFDAHVAGGRLAGRFALRRGKDGLEVQAHLDLAGLDAAAVLPSEGRPAIGGRLSGKLDLEATGLSPKALIGSLSGRGTVTLEDGYLSSLDPKVFDTIIRASDQGLAMDAPRVRDIVTAGLDSGRLHVPRIETVMSINAGQMRVANAVADVDGAKLAAAGNFDLIQQQVDLRITLTGPERNDGSSGRPDIFVGLKGPVLTPQRTVDVSALAGWLTIRRIDQQAKKLEALEAAQREQEAARERAARARPVSPAPAAASAPPIQPAEPSVAAPVTAPAPAAPVRRPLHEAARPAPAKPAAPAAVRSRAVAPPAPRAIEARPSPSAEPESPPSTAALPQAAPVVPLAPALEPHAPAVPPLPAPREIRSIPRGPDRVQGSAVQPPSEPLRLPSSQPSVLDSLVGPQR